MQIAQRGRNVTQHTANRITRRDTNDYELRPLGRPSLGQRERKQRSNSVITVFNALLWLQHMLHKGSGVRFGDDYIMRECACVWEGRKVCWVFTQRWQFTQWVCSYVIYQSQIIKSGNLFFFVQEGEPKYEMRLNVGMVTGVHNSWVPVTLKSVWPIILFVNGSLICSLCFSGLIKVPMWNPETLKPRSQSTSLHVCM
jgi:hypothetical protein